MSSDFFHNTFLDGRLIGSEAPGALGSPELRVRSMMAGRTPLTLLTLTPRTRAYALAGLTQFHVPLEGLPTRDQVAEAVQIVRERLALGDCVWVHCQHGWDRTGVVIGGYLVQSGEEADQVIAMLMDRFPPARRHPRMRELWRPYEELIRSFART